MRRFSLYYLCIVALSLFFFACKKDDPAPQQPIIPPTLNVGRAATSFTSNPSFAGSTSFSSSNAPASSATSVVSGNSRTIILNTKHDVADTFRYATIYISLPDTLNTTAGILTANLSQPVGSVINASVTIRSSLGTTPLSNYNSVSGSLGITKITNAEIEGEFVANVSDGLTSVLVLSNGTFAGRFQ